MVNYHIHNNIELYFKNINNILPIKSNKSNTPILSDEYGLLIGIFKDTKTDYAQLDKN